MDEWFQKKIDSFEVGWKRNFLLECVGCVRNVNYGLSLKSENREDFYKRGI